LLLRIGTIVFVVTVACIGTILVVTILFTCGAIFWPPHRRQWLVRGYLTSKNDNVNNE